MARRHEPEPERERVACRRCRWMSELYERFLSRELLVAAERDNPVVSLGRVSAKRSDGE